MEFLDIKKLLNLEFGTQTFQEYTQTLQPNLLVETQKIAQVCLFLHEHPELYFDFLSCLTGIDNGTTQNTMEVAYHLYSIPFGHSLALRVVLPRQNPVIATVSTVWKAANWHEREAYDLLGIQFENHPDLRRILMPNDWIGHPLQKDYEPQTHYHGIKVAFEQNEK